MMDRLDRASRVPGPSCTVLTASGRGAIGVVRVWGPGSIEVADQAFRPHSGPRLLATPVGRLRVGRIGQGLGDEVVAVVVEGPRSPEIEVEVQCHGGPSAVELVVDALVNAGSTRRSPRAWTRHRSGSRLRADAEVALASASTLRVASILLDQAQGALDEELRWIAGLTAEQAIPRLDALIARAGLGGKLIEGWRVVLAGRPNVGKSRLLNALAGFDRSIVGPEAGTTRDVVTVRSAIDGWPVELADTAGLRTSTDPIETEGVTRARAHQRLADLVLVVLDRSEPLDPADDAVLADHPRGLIVASKSDLAPSWEATSLGARAVSALTGDGIEGLVKEIGSRLVPEVPPPGVAFPFQPAQIRRLQRIRSSYLEGNNDQARRWLDRWARLT